MEPSEGVMLTEVILLAFDGAPVTDGGFVLPVGSVEKAVLEDCTALASEPVPAPHPEPQKAKAISKMKKRKNGRLCG